MRKRSRPNWWPFTRVLEEAELIDILPPTDRSGPRLALIQPGS
jgi:hypothetical protein